MTSSNDDRPSASGLQRGIVLRVREDDCDVATGDGRRTVGYARNFPSPHTERVSPSDLVAIATAVDGSDVIVWRWYDAVVLDESDDVVRLWEPAHGEVSATRRPAYRSAPPGSRAYLSAGLPGADWWVAGPAVSLPDNAEVELDEVKSLYIDYGLWEEL